MTDLVRCRDCRHWGDAVEEEDEFHRCEATNADLTYIEGMWTCDSWPTLATRANFGCVLGEPKKDDND